MQSENKYIGDDKFKKFLEHYSCPTPLDVIKLRFIGAICSPNLELRPSDVISSLWENNQTPRLETKNEADLFFKFMMGLWDEMYNIVACNSVVLPKISPTDNLIIVCEDRYNQLEQGFVEGFWGGKENVNIPSYIAEIIDSLTELAETYHKLVAKVNPQKDNKTVFEALQSCDKMATKSINFLIDNYVLPRIDDLKRTMN